MADASRTVASLERAFFVRPVEAIHFGPPRSFSAGEAHHASSLFPPPPSTFQGVLRSHLLRCVPGLDLASRSPEARAERAALVGDADRLPEGWRLQGPLPAVLTEPADPEEDERPVLCPWVPAPRFLLGPAGGGPPSMARPVRSTHSALDDRAAGGREALWLGRPDLGAVGPLGGWLGPAGLRWALDGAPPGRWPSGQHEPDLPPFVQWEARPGLALGPGGMAREGMLYFLRSLRFGPGGGLLGWLRGVLHGRIPADALERGAAAVGRKGRVALVEPVERLHSDWRWLADGHHLPEEPADGALFWLLALTPVQTSDPAAPELPTGLAGGVDVVMRAALTGRPMAFGGFDMVRAAPRPNRSYLPAGSAWLIALRGGTAGERGAVLRRLNNTNALGSPEGLPFGFGHILIGLGPAPENAEGEPS